MISSLISSLILSRLYSCLFGQVAKSLRLFWNVVSLYRTSFDTLGPFCESEHARLHRVKRTAILLAPGMPNTGIRSRSKKRPSDLHKGTLEPLWNLSPRPFELAGAAQDEITNNFRQLIGGRTGLEP